MLDNSEPTDAFAAERSGDQGGAAAPKARKAPAKRAPRKTPAKKAAAAVAGPAGPDAGAGDPAVAMPAAAPADQPGADAPAPKKATRARKAPAAKAAAARATEAPASEPPVSEPPASETSASDAPATKATAAKAPAAKAPAAKASAAKAPARKRAARGAAATPAEPEAAAPATAESTPIPSTPIRSAPADGPAADSATESPAAAPAKRTPRKRVSKAAAAAAEQAAAEQAAAASVAEVPAPEALPAAPALAAPAVLFQPPTEAAAPRRRRGGKRAAEPIAEPEPDVDALPDETDIDADLEPEDVDEPADDRADEEGDETAGEGTRRRRRRGRRGRGRSSDTSEDADTPVADLGEDDDELEDDHAEEVAEAALSASARRRRRRRRSTGSDGAEAVPSEDDPPNTVVHVRETRSGRDRGGDDDGVRGVKGSTRLEAKRQRRRDNRDTGRRRAPILTEAEFLARRESVDRVMAVRQAGDRTQIAVLEDDILVEHYVTRASASSAVGNVYLGRVQNVLPSMEAAVVDIGPGRNGVLYAGEVNWDVAGLEGKSRSIENALSAGDMVLVQVTKDPIGHKGARLTSQISLPGRFVVYVPGGGMTGISRKLPDVERSRLKAILKKVVPDEAGVIVRTAAEGASEQDLVSDVERLKSEWEKISARSAKAKQSSEGPSLLHGEPDLAIRVVRDIFNDDFKKLVVSGAEIHRTLSDYVSDIAPDLADRISRHTAESDLFRDLRVDEQLAKALDRKVWLPSGGSLVIDRTEAMTVVDVNTGKYTGSGGNLEQTVTRNNLEAAEELVRQLRLRDIGGIVVIDFIDMVLESNRDLVLRRLTECLGRDRTKHQVAEVTSLGLVQMTRKRVGEGLLEAFSEPCTVCNGRGVIVHLDPVERKNGGSAGSGASAPAAEDDRPARGRRTRKAAKAEAVAQPDPAELAAEAEKRRAAASAVAAIAAATNLHDGAAASSAATSGTDRLESSSADGQPATGQPATGHAESSPAESSPAESSPAESGQLESEQPAGGKPARRSGGRRRASRDAGAAGEPAAAAVQPAAEAAPSEQPRQADQPRQAEPQPGAAPAAAEPTYNGAGSATPDLGASQSGAAQPVRPRRRRAASRPAGPPVPVSVPEG
jgi:ribonuclease E